MDVNDPGALRLCGSVDARQPAFEDVFRAEYQALVRVISPIVGSVQDAEAVVQDAFVKAFTGWKRIGGYDRPGAWVRRVAIRDAVRFGHGKRRTQPTPAPGADPMDAVPVYIDLGVALRGLSSKQRACVVLHYLADLPVRDVAEAVGCSEATVRVHLHRARVALADLLQPDPEEMTRWK